MQENEDLSSNSFFKILKQHYQRIYLEAEKNCSLICVPQESACNGLKCTRHIIESHILQPSPYFQGEYFTINKKTVDIEDNFIVTKSGFKEQKKIKILFEELFYNKEYKSFRVLCIELPLEGTSKTNESTDNALKLPQNKSFEGCCKFLNSFDVNIIVLRKMKQQIQEFNDTYVLVKGYENDACKKVELLCTEAFEALLIANPDFRQLHKRSSPLLNDLKQIVESFLIGHLHHKLVGGLKSINALEDQFLASRINCLQSMTPADFGVREELCCEMPEAITELQKLHSYVTPLEKLQCLQETNSLITAAVGRRMDIHNAEAYAITTDDLIPLIVYAVVKAQPSHLHTNIWYMENFTFSNFSANSLGFTLVSFQAAIEYIKSDKLSAGKENGPAIDRQYTASPIVFPPRTLSSSFSRPEDPPSKRSGPLRSTPSANQVSIPVTGSKEFVLDSNPRPPNFRAPPSVISVKNEKEDDFGDFLSKLRNDT